jgi:hypothetical protein
MTRTRRRGGTAFTGNPTTDQSLRELDRNQAILNALGGSKKRKKPKKKSYKK